MIIPSYGRVKLDEHMDPLNRPAYVFAEIDAFFADSRTTSRTSTKGVMADLQTAYPGPFPDLPQIAASADSQPACNEHLTDEQQTYFCDCFGKPTIRSCKLRTKRNFNRCWLCIGGAIPRPGNWPTLW